MNFYDKPKVYGDIVSHYKKFADGKQAIAYCAAIVQSEKLCDEFISNGNKAAHIDAKTPKEKRTEIIEKFRSGEGCLGTAGDRKCCGWGSEAGAGIGSCDPE